MRQGGQRWRRDLDQVDLEVCQVDGKGTAERLFQGRSSKCFAGARQRGDALACGHIGSVSANVTVRVGIKLCRGRQDNAGAQSARFIDILQRDLIRTAVVGFSFFGVVTTVHGVAGSGLRDVGAVMDQLRRTRRTCGEHEQGDQGDDMSDKNHETKLTKHG